MRRALLVAVLVLLAGCGSAVPGDDATPSETTTAAPVPTEEPVTYPPGLANGTLDADALAAATRGELAGTAYSLRFDRREARPEPSLGAVYVGPRVDASVAGPSRYVLNYTLVSERGGGIGIETLRNATSVDGDTATVLTRNGTTTRPAGANATGYPSRLADEVVERYLTVENATVTRFENGSAVVRGNGTTIRNASDYSVTAVVAPDGVVRRLDAIFVRDDRVQFVRFRSDRNATFEPPRWTLEATNATATAQS